MNQQAIAKKLGISRPGVSRLLLQAREQGIVKIEIHDPRELGTRLEQALKAKYSLKQAIVVPNGENDDRVVKGRLGQAAVIYLDARPL